MAHWIALIRAIGPKTHKLMSMADLRLAAETRGLSEVRTVLATGNLLFRSRKGKATLQRMGEEMLTGIGLSLPENAVFLLTPDDLRAAMQDMPLPDARAARPARLLYVATASPLDAAARARLATWDKGPERFAPSGSGVWIDYADGVGTSQLTTKRLEKLLGQPGTGRNWNTLGRLLN